MKIPSSSIFKICSLISGVILSINFCFAQEVGKPVLSIRSYLSKKEIVVYEGEYIKIIVDEKQFKSHWKMVNDSMLELSGKTFVIDNIDNIKVGHSGSYIAAATGGGLVCIMSLGLALVGFSQAAQAEVTSEAIISLFIAIPMAALSYISFKYTFGQIQKSSGYSKNKFKISILK